MFISIRTVILIFASALCALCVSCAKKPIPLSLTTDCGGAMLSNSLDRCVVQLSGGDTKQSPVWTTLSIVDSEGRATPDAVDIVEKTANRIEFQARLKPGRIVVAARRGDEKKVIRINIAQDESDSDSDGFPDVAEINTQNDRNSFRMWFTTIAESQTLHESDSWNPENRDCAGLVRFAYREALRTHDTAALAKFKSLTRTDIPDIGKFNYPDVPIIGEKLFRTIRGEFKKSDVDNGVFSPFVSARFLQEANTSFVSKRIEDAQPADLLFFLHFDDTSMPYHSMIFLGAKSRGPDAGQPMIVYHTGPVSGTKGRIKLITLSALMDFKDDRWRPVPDNEFFMGVYRFRILD